MFAFLRDAFLTKLAAHPNNGNSAQILQKSRYLRSKIIALCSLEKWLSLPSTGLGRVVIISGESPRSCLSRELAANKLARGGSGRGQWGSRLAFCRHPF